MKNSVAIIVLLLSATSAVAAGSVAIPVDAETHPFLARIYAVHDDGSRGMCSGTVIRPGFIATAAHCFERRLKDAEQTIRISGKANIHFESCESGGFVQSTKVLFHHSREADFALVIYQPQEDCHTQYIPPLTLDLRCCENPLEGKANGKRFEFCGYRGETSAMCTEIRRSAIKFDGQRYLVNRTIVGDAMKAGDSGGSFIYENPAGGRFLIATLSGYGKHPNMTCPHIDSYWVQASMASNPVQERLETERPAPSADDGHSGLPGASGPIRILSNANGEWLESRFPGLRDTDDYSIESHKLAPGCIWTTPIYSRMADGRGNLIGVTARLPCAGLFTFKLERDGITSSSNAVQIEFKSRE